MLIHDLNKMIKRYVDFYTKLFNNSRPQNTTPDVSKDLTNLSPDILLSEVRDAITVHIKNYRPISLLPVIHKSFSNAFLKRMLRTLDHHQPREQAGFRPGFSAIDHIQVDTQL